MKIVVLVKHVPEPTATWGYADDLTLDRGAVEGRLSELDEYAVEQAVRLVENGLHGDHHLPHHGPGRGRRRPAQGAVHGWRRRRSTSCDDALHGSDSLATSLVLAGPSSGSASTSSLCGMASTDAEMSVVPAMVADRLGVPQLTFATSLSVDDESVTIRRDGDTSLEDVAASLAGPGVRDRPDRRGPVPVLQVDHGRPRRSR